MRGPLKQCQEQAPGGSQPPFVDHPVGLSLVSRNAVGLDKADGDERKEIEVVTERLERARRFHDKVSGLLSNPLVDHLL